MDDAKVYWCCNCHEYKIKYCGTTKLIGDSPKTKGKPCALQATDFTAKDIQYAINKRLGYE